MRKFPFLFAGFLFVVFFLPVFAQSDSGGEKSDKRHLEGNKTLVLKSPLQGQIALGGFSFPLTVDKVIKDLGSPDHTFVDDNGSCPIGQLHSWRFDAGNYMFSALGDCYKEKLDYKANSRLIGVQKCDPDRPSRFEGFLGIRLDDSEEDVKMRLDSFVTDNPMFRVWQSDDGSPIHPFFGVCNQFKHQYVLESSEVLFFFMINKGNKLEAIVQATFNVLAAC